MKQVNIGAFQKNLKKAIYKNYLQNSDVYGLKLKPSVEISGKLSNMSYVVITLDLLKPDHMCPKEKYVSNSIYDEEDAAKIYDDIVNRRQWAPGYPYNEMPVCDEMREICEQIEHYVFNKTNDIFDVLTVQVAVVFKTADEIGDQWKQQRKEDAKWLKDNKKCTPAEMEDAARFLNREKTGGDWRQAEEPLDDRFD